MDKATGGKNRSTAAIFGAAEFVASACLFFFYIQAYRDVLISPGGFEQIKWIIYTFLLAPILAGFLNLIPLPGLFALAGGCAAMAGRWLMLAPNLQSYYWGEYLTIGGFWLYFVSHMMFLKAKCQGYRDSRYPLALFVSGFMAASALHLSLRALDKVESDNIVLALIALCFAALVCVSLFPPRPEARGERDEQGRGSILAGFAILFAAIPFQYLFQWALKPEIFSAVAGSTYAAMAGGVKMTLFLAVAFLLLSSSGRSASGAGTIAGALCAAAAVIFGAMFDLAQGSALFILILAGLFGTIAALFPILLWFQSRRIPGRAIFLGLAGAFISFFTVYMKVYFLEHHNPKAHWMMAGPLAAVLFAISLAGGKSLKASGKSGGAMKGYGSAFAFAALATLAAALTGMKPPTAATGAYEPKVMACLYTWYGTPGKPFGTYGNESLTRLALPTSWDASRSTAKGAKLTLADKIVQAPGLNVENMTEREIRQELKEKQLTYLKATGESEGPGSDSIILTSQIDASKLNAPRNYFFFRMSFDPNLVAAKFYVAKDGAKKWVGVKPNNNTNFRPNVVYPNDFQPAEGAAAGPDEMGFEIQCLKAGPCEFAISDVTVSRWRHWDEDYHTAEINGKWYNDPPDTLAAEHRMHYEGKPWEEIPSFSPDGYYDSWDPTVVRAQIMLMEKSGIDAILIMHPPDLEIADMIVKILEELDSPLQFAFWMGYRQGLDPNGIEFLDRFQDNPRYLKVNGRPFWVAGPTGMLEEPYKVYEKNFAEIRRRTNAFIVGDNYAPPKEEMMSLLDGHYYYDTTGLYRCRWGSKNIQVAQPNAVYVTGFGHLDIIFRAIANITHARKQMFLATIIPGCSNISVHGFNGTPLYDGRPGTVVKRHGGLTYAETWKSAIRSGADWACIVSWNELHEGTEIEPTMEDGVFYVQETKKWAEAFRTRTIPPGE